VFAPGMNTTSAGITSPTSTEMASGTSMACPHVAGVAAYIISAKGNSSPAELSATIKGLSVQGVLTGMLYKHFVVSRSLLILDDKVSRRERSTTSPTSTKLTIRSENVHPDSLSTATISPPYTCSLPQTITLPTEYLVSPDLMV
jgi:subtilisin family serine protease